MVTANEVCRSKDLPEQFHPYRVINFAWDPRLYVVGGALSRQCRLEPVQYRVSAEELRFQGPSRPTP